MEMILVVMFVFGRIMMGSIAAGKNDGNAEDIMALLNVRSVSDE